MSDQHITQAYEYAREAYRRVGVDTEQALSRLAHIPISLHCWQGDDVRGFEDPDAELTGGIAVTGNYLGRARSAQELRQDLDKAYSLIPGQHRLNLHASYLEADTKVARNEIEAQHFAGWLAWAKEKQHGLDFNPTCFSHPLSDDGFTLAHHDDGIRQFWIEHCQAARRIGDSLGRELGNPAVTNIWIPDGLKDTPADRKSPRLRLEAALDEVLAEPLDHNLDAVECKLFGLGSESYVVGSHEFYLGYAVKNQTLLCLDAGHFHPTEVISDKISSVLQFVPELLLHVSRGVRWDSDHVVTLSDELRAIMQELVRGDFLGRTHIGLDFFDASINRIAAWVVGTRNTIKALLLALLEPQAQLKALELEQDYSSRLALLEELKSMPFGAVWDYYCQQQEVPLGMTFMAEIKAYEQAVLVHR